MKLKVNFTEVIRLVWKYYGDWEEYRLVCGWWSIQNKTAFPRNTERIQAQETWGERKIKGEMTDDGWMVGAAESRLLIPRSEISFPLFSLRLFHMRAPAPSRLHPQGRGWPSPASPWHFTTRKWEYRGSKTKDMLSIISCTAQRASPSKQELKLGLHREAWGWLNVIKSLAQRKKLEVETG